MAIKKWWVIVSSRIRAEKKVKWKVIWNDAGKSFYFIWPRTLGSPLYVWYIIEDYWSKIFVWLLKRGTQKHKECTINKHIITYDKQNDQKYERELFYSANIPRTSI